MIKTEQKKIEHKAEKDLILDFLINRAIINPDDNIYGILVPRILRANSLKKWVKSPYRIMSMQ